MRKLEKAFWILSGMGWLTTLAFPVEHTATLAFLPLLIGGLASLASGAIGAIANASAADRAAMLKEKGMQEWFKLNIPDPAQQKLALERFVQAGELHPALEQSIKAESSEFGDITQDEGLRNSRLRALSGLEEQGFGGEQTQDTAAREQAMIDSGSANRGRQEAVISDFARRGQLGSGLELSARLDAAQAEGDRLASGALDLEGQRRNRMLAALEGAGNLAGNIQETDYKTASDKARANDAINLFNTQNMVGMQQRNIDRANDASQYNLGVKQDISNRNVGTSNYEQEKNKSLIQQDFENRKAKAAGLSDQYGGQAAQATQQGQATGNMWGGVASGIGTLAQGYQNQNNFDELLKKKYGS